MIKIIFSNSILEEIENETEVFPKIEMFHMTITGKKLSDSEIDQFENSLKSTSMGFEEISTEDDETVLEIFPSLTDENTEQKLTDSMMEILSNNMKEILNEDEIEIIKDLI